MIEFTKHEPITKQLYWVQKALTTKKDDPRKHVTHICVADEKIIATDGQRLHCYCENDVLINGFYAVVKATKTKIILDYKGSEIDYPESRDLFIVDEPLEYFVVGGININASYAKIIRSLKESTMDFRYIEDLLCLDEVFNCFTRDDESPIVFENDSKKAIIMPRRM